MARTKAKGAHYVDNKKFHQAMIDWKEKCKDAEEAGDEVPQITDYIGSCFLKIANGLSYRPNFINYTYRFGIIAGSYFKFIIIDNNIRELFKEFIHLPAP